MTVKAKNETLVKYVSDLISLDKHIIEAVNGQLADKNMQEYAEAARTLSKIQGTLQSDVVALEQNLERLGGDSGSPVKKAATAIAGAAASVIDKVRADDNISKMLRDTYTALSLNAISSTMLHTTALVMDEESTATVALAHLKSVTPLIVEISKVMPHVVEHELAVSNPEIQREGVAEESLRQTQTAW
jgi:ferritin-like metal-binding protein YciE